MKDTYRVLVTEHGILWSRDRKWHRVFGPALVKEDGSAFYYVLGKFIHEDNLRSRNLFHK